MRPGPGLGMRSIRARDKLKYKLAIREDAANLRDDLATHAAVLSGEGCLEAPQSVLGKRGRADEEEDDGNNSNNDSKSTWPDTVPKKKRRRGGKNKTGKAAKAVEELSNPNV